MVNITEAGVLVFAVCYTNVHEDCKKYLTTFSWKCDVGKSVGYKNI
jgi:hypothetical protein